MRVTANSMMLSSVGVNQHSLSSDAILVLLEGAAHVVVRADHPGLDGALLMRGGADAHECAAVQLLFNRVSQGSLFCARCNTYFAQYVTCDFGSIKFGVPYYTFSRWTPSAARVI